MGTRASYHLVGYCSLFSFLMKVQSVCLLLSAESLRSKATLILF